MNLKVVGEEKRFAVAMAENLIFLKTEEMCFVVLPMTTAKSEGLRSEDWASGCSLFCTDYQLIRKIFNV